MNNIWKNLAAWVVVLAVLVFLYQFMKDKKEGPEKIDYSNFYKSIQWGEVKKVTFNGNKITGEFTDGKKFVTYGPNDLEKFGILAKENVEVDYQNDEESPMWRFMVAWLPLLIMIGFMIFFFRQMQNSGGKAMAFGKSRARLLNESHKKVTFADVAGIDEAKEELQEIIEFLKNPKKFTRLGGRIPKGVLLVGPPGTGKTLLARAIAGEAGVPFFSISGSDFVEMFVGVGASRVRDLFLQGKKNAPCIIFIDEIDAVGRQRGAGLGGGHDEREQTLNQLLVEMDGFESNDGVILISATNRPDVLDPALLRPGRFDRQVVVPTPDVRGRLGILKVHTRKTPLDEKVDLEVIARGTPGFNGADIENLVNEAALLAARKDKEKVEADDFEYAKDKVIMGLERKSMIISEEERIIIANHESGHALVARLLPGTDPVHKVTIIPRGIGALGATMQLPAQDKYLKTKSCANNDIAILMGGRVAEELTIGEQTTGAHNDLRRATEMAHKMVTEWGMSDLGPMTFGRREEMIFLGREVAHQQDFSESTALDIDRQVKRIISENYERVKVLLQGKMDVLYRLASTLLEHEVLDGWQIDAVIRGEELPHETIGLTGGDAAVKPEQKKERAEKPAPELIPQPPKPAVEQA